MTALMDRTLGIVEELIKTSLIISILVLWYHPLSISLLFCSAQPVLG